jgi:hypothetical protein
MELMLNFYKRFHYFFILIADRDLQIGHRPANVVKDKKLNFVTWEPYFCVLLQDEQTLTAYRSEELSVNADLFFIIIPR